VGRGQYLVVLTSDHGVCPLPEVARARGHDSGRVSIKRLEKEAEAALEKTYGAGAKERWIEETVGDWFYLNRGLLARRGLKSAEVEATAAAALKDQPGVLAVYTRSQLAGGGLTEDPVGQAVRRSFHPDRSGDVMVVLKPYHVATGEDLVGTTHGSPHSYDTHVPLLVHGPGVPAGARADLVSPQAVAAILASALDFAPPAGTEAPLPDALRKP
jgi:hypothetical protein